MSILWNDIEDLFEVHTSLPQTNLPPKLDRVYIDSRKIIFGSRSLFFALRGSRQDGHSYIRDAYDKGVRVFCISKNVDTGLFPQGYFLKVSDTLAALQAIAQRHRQRHDIAVYGITGSNGKTIVKEWLAQLLKCNHNICSSPGSYNSQVGVPLSIMRLEDRHDAGVFEAGISTVDEMNRLADMIRPTLGVLTNIGDAHSQGFDSKLHKLHEKLRLFRSTEQWIYCRDHQLIHDEVLRIQDPRARCWSLHDPSAHLYFKRTPGLLVAIFGHEEYSLPCPFDDPHAVENYCHTVAALILSGVSHHHWREKVEHLRTPEWRLEVTQGPHQSTLINDSYNHDLLGLEQALMTLQAYAPPEHRMVLLTSMEDQGHSHAAIGDQIHQLLLNAQVHHLLTLDMSLELHQIISEGLDSSQRLENSAQALELLPSILRHDDVLLIKGARRYSLNQLAESLNAHMHRTYLKINLSAISRNLGVLTTKLQPSTKLMAMVKAGSYGSGIQLVKHLERERIDYLGVAFLNEAIELRQNGIQCPILVMNTEAHQLNLLQRYHLDAQVNTLEQLQLWIDYSQDFHDPVPLHINLDTGMNRLGIPHYQWDQLLLILSQNQIELKGLMTHLAASDMEDQDQFTVHQMELFDGFRQKIETKVRTGPILCHVLNSSGILRHSEWQADMVRVGIALYGLQSPQSLDIEHSHGLYTKIVQVKSLEPGESVGYGRSFVASQTMTIATLSCGYADGIPRALSQSEYSFLLRDQYVPLVGHICMDFCMIDVTAISNPQIGEEVCIFGPRNSVVTLSDKANTIPYEIISNISPRVHRVYVYENH